ncbi:MAG: pyridoxal phosphate-dependent aminotransferase [Chloroflexi bacterium]|nr:MAG: pyridoxal phosphate-dependent aminotransferase [Chloroflexota bacterium]TME53949.1 MAG: pyridoxal phosphate-dependent aminotransferase [Chloroflexota bacterium]
MSRLGTESAFEVLAKARRLEAEGKHIVHLEIGEPDFATPDNIVEAGISAMQNGYTHYTPAAGILEARQAVAGFVTRMLNIEVDAGEVVLVPGSKNVLLFTLLSCIEPGDEVILPDPGYPAYASQVNFIGAVPKVVTLREETGFRMDLDELASLITPKTRMLIINTPQNPTGGVLTEEDVRFVCDLANEHDLMIVSDEIYSQLVYGFHHISPLSHAGMRERTVLMDGLSKSYAMTGWRLGYAVAPKPLAAKLEQLMINSSSCAAAFTQMAAIEALSAPESEHAVNRMVKVFQHRRDLVVDGLNEIEGVRCARPQGAFYAFPNIEGTGFGERELADRLLSEAGVAVLPGTAFGAAGKGYIRIAYTQSEDELKRGLDRIKDFVTANK